jgi:hypothetical protein
MMRQSAINAALGAGHTVPEAGGGHTLVDDLQHFVKAYEELSFLEPAPEVELDYKWAVRLLQSYDEADALLWARAHLDRLDVQWVPVLNGRVFGSVHPLSLLAYERLKAKVERLSGR